MRSDERAHLDGVLKLAQQVAERLSSVSVDETSPAALPLRLAQAYALGLIDQLEEIVAVPVSDAAPPVPPAVQPRRGAGDDEIIHV